MVAPSVSGEPATAPRGGSGAMFDPIAPRYDLLNRVLSLGIDRGWRRRAANALSTAASRPGARLLDLATGTGDLALRLARTYPEAQIVGLDPSRGMLAIARRKLAAAGLAGRVRLACGDGERLPFPDLAFDGATLAFGIRNVPDRPRALRELCRVLRPGGRLAILELSEPRSGVFAPLARFHVHTVVPRVGAWLSGAPAYRYLERSIAAFPPPAAFAEVIARSGLRMVAVEALTLGVATLFVAERPA